MPIVVSAWLFWLCKIVLHVGMNDLERLVLAAAGSGRVLNQTDDLRWLAHKHAEDQTKFIESGGTYDYATCGPHSWMVSPPQGGQSEHLS